MKWIIAAMVMAVCMASCSTSKEQMDNSIVAYGRKNTETIKELAQFAIEHWLATGNNSFNTRDLADRKMRKKFNRSGYSGTVTVTFFSPKNPDATGPEDSVVIFKEITLRGVREIIYDFAARQRQFANDTRNRQNSVFLQVADRIYYRRRPFPMM